VEVNLRPNMNVVSVGQAPPHQAVVVIELINHSGHPVKIVGQGFLPQRRGGPGTFVPRPRGLPASGVFEIPARDSVSVWLEYGDLETLDRKRAARYWVKTSDNRTFKSKRHRLTEPDE
jgi:hypothetical protein